MQLNNDDNKDFNLIISFLESGILNREIKVGDKISKVIRLLGKPENQIGDNNVGFLKYKKGLRFGYTTEYIDEIGFLFPSWERSKYSVTYSSVDNFTISGATRVENFIKLLNYRKIKWNNWDKKSMSAFTLKVDSNVLVIFNLDSGKLYQIVYGNTTNQLINSIK